MAATVPSSRTRPCQLPASAVARLRGLLVEQLRQNAEQASVHEATARQLAGQTDGDSAIERELALACALRAREVIDETEEALGRIADGTYGSCLVCGEPIPFERLEVIPHARMCVACLHPRGFRRP